MEIQIETISNDYAKFNVVKVLHNGSKKRWKMFLNAWTLATGGKNGIYWFYFQCLQLIRKTITMLNYIGITILCEECLKKCRPTEYNGTWYIGYQRLVLGNSKFWFLIMLFRIC